MGHAPVGFGWLMMVRGVDDRRSDPVLWQGAAQGTLLRVADQAAAADGALDRAAIGDVRIETDGRTVSETADMVIAQTAWAALTP
jgi:hypothetical protein